MNPETIRGALLSVIAMTMAGGIANAQSFDCSKAASDVERTVCQDRGLIELDNTLASELKSSLAAAPDQEQFILSMERRWIVDRDAHCEVSDQAEKRTCLTSAYQKRINDLKDQTQMRRESTGATAKTDRILRPWLGYYGTHAIEVDLVVQRGPLDYIDGDHTCVQMEYRVVGQKDNLFVLEINAPVQCLDPSREGLYFVLALDPIFSDKALTFRQYASAREALDAWRSPADDGGMRLLDIGMPQADVAKLVSADKRLEYRGGCPYNHARLTGEQVALMRALEYNEETQVQQILSHPIDVNFKSSGWSPLSIAAEQGNLRLVKALLEAGARADGKAADGHCAADTLLELETLSGYWPSSFAIKEALLTALQVRGN